MKYILSEGRMKTAQRRKKRESCQKMYCSAWIKDYAKSYGCHNPESGKVFIFYQICFLLKKNKEAHGYKDNIATTESTTE